jgi:signal transduction histidine kinase
LINEYLQRRQDNLLSYRLLVYILLCSTLLAILSTAIQLLWDYKKDVDSIVKGIDSIEASYLDSLSSSLWKLDKDQIAIQLDGIMKLQDIGYASITEIVAEQEESVFFRGEAQRQFPIARSFDLYYRDTLVGRLEVAATLDNVYQRLLEKFFIILSSQAVKTFLVSICILMIVHYMVVKHINALARYTQRLGLDNLDESFELDNNWLRRSQEPDSIDQLSDTLNQMRLNIRKQLAEKRAAKDELVNLNAELEQRVKYRTATLKHTNDRLSEALNELTDTKDKLVETEKMAALGELVNGIAKQIEKPVSHAQQLSSQIQSSLSELDSSDSQAIDQIDQHSNLLQQQFKQMADLINVFRQIAIDPQNSHPQRLNLSQLIAEVEQAFATRLKEQQVSFHYDCDNSLELATYPDSLKQLFALLIDNALLHGFCGKVREQGDQQINIKAEREGDQLRLSFSDNGVGVAESILPKLFDPFVATHGERGGSGLGTHLVYRIVTGLLQGRIHCHSTRGKGTEFIIKVPTSPIQKFHANEELW